MQLQSAVLPFQLGVSLTETPVVPTAVVPDTLITPAAEIAALPMNLVVEITIAAVFKPPQLLTFWQCSVIDVRADEAPRMISDTRARIV